MLRYMGGKTRIAKDISRTIYEYKSNKHKRYLEPFFGGGSLAPYTQTFGLNRYASDINEDLILMYQALQSGWIPPKEITESLYKELKYSQPSALRGYVGFSMSFGGIWFGGYARDKQNKRNFAQESYKRIIAGLPYIQDIHFKHKDVFTFNNIHEVDLVYADPPYANTFRSTSHHSGYSTDNFNHEAFWNVVRSWSNSGATVLISEYEAPDDFKIVWEKPYKTYGITLGQTKDKLERLFMWKG